MVGLQCSLQSKKTVQAVMVSTGAVIFLSLLLSGCVMSVANIGHAAAAFVFPFSPFWAFAVLIDPAGTLFESGAAPTGSQLTEVRVVSLIGCALAAGILFLITFAQYRHMVRSFDMTVRRQSA
jgi:hypothetical protein